MNSFLRSAAVVVVLGSASVVSACGSGKSAQEQSFSYSGRSLSVVSETANMPVSVSVRDGVAPKGEEVKVSVTTQTMGKSASTPAWSLSKDTLTLASPCGKGWVGYCEGSFTVTVPQGVSVSVNGKPVNAG
ncbi:hypothetical protein [Arsenicicoccus dermatophilus]|uniref:hypothetical protein n=1 Tax=Arsenicicoccus dermatophilus TaxID=1076331 RepID=UPI0039171A1C